MIKKIISGYFSKLSEGKIHLEELYKRRSAKKKIPTMTDGEFFSYLKLSDDDLRDIREAYREREFDTAKKELLKFYRKRDFPAWFFSTLMNRKIYREYSNSYRYTMESAEKSCAHIIDSRFGESKNFGTFIDWFSDFDGRSWIFCHISDLQKKLADRHFQKLFDLSNLPLTLEFNKHHHLVDLGRAYLMSADERYAQEYVVEIEDWIEKNPVNWGVNWLEPLTVSQRLVSWLFSLGMFIPSRHISGDSFCKIMKSLLLHGAHIIEHIADRSTIPSKLIGLASALFLLASSFPEFEFLREWKERAEKTLEREASTQFSPDGVHREQSLGLQCVLTEFLLLPLIWKKMNNEPSLPALEAPVEKSLEFLMCNIQPNGRAQVFGEVPLTRVWHLEDSSQEDYRSLLALGALFFGRGDMKFIAGERYEDILWFFSREGVERYRRMTAFQPSTVSRAFNEGGYFIFRDEWDRDSTFCLFHSGPKKKWGYLEKGMEGLPRHRDLLHFSLAIRGEPFLIETGSYRGKKQFRNYFGNSSAHNVLKVGGREQSLSKSFKGTKKFLQMLKTRWLFTEDYCYAMAGIPGFEELKSLVVHRREILYLREKKWFLIKDSLEGFDEYLVELFFHFAPELEIILRGDYGCFIRGRKDYVRLNPYFPDEFSCSLNRGKNNPMAGWYAKDFMRVEPCYRLEYFARLKLPSEIYTWISWARGEFRIPSKEEIMEHFLKISEHREHRKFEEEDEYAET